MVVRKAHNLEVRVRFPTPQHAKGKMAGLKSSPFFVNI